MPEPAQQMNAACQPLLRYRGKFVVRTVGAVLLTTSAVLIVLGLTVLRERLQGLAFIRYWMWCFWLALAAIGAAMVDIALLRRAARRLRRELFREQFLPIARSQPDKTRSE